MIPAGVQVFVALEPINLRFSFDRLAGLALEQVGIEARSGALFVFFSKRRDALKIPFCDGSGMCVFYKRLDKGTFRLPEPVDATTRHVEMDDAALDALLDGVEIAVPPRAARRRVH